MIDRVLLAKILSRTSSSSDAEALTALKKANEVIGKAGTTWGEILGVDTVMRPRVTPVPPRRYGARGPQVVPPFTTTDLGDLVAEALNNMAYNLGRGLRGDRRRGR